MGGGLVPAPQPPPLHLAPWGLPAEKRRGLLASLQALFFPLKDVSAHSLSGFDLSANLT